MKINRNKKGFTLLEIFIVVVVLGVVAGLMFPVLTAQIERSRAQEAITALGTVREAAVKYWQTTGGSSYTGMTFANIGYNPDADAAGQTRLFSYNFTPAPEGDTFTCVATRRVDVPNVPNAPEGVNTVSINEAGTIVRSGAYA